MQEQEASLVEQFNYHVAKIKEATYDYRAHLLQAQLAEEALMKLRAPPEPVGVETHLENLREARENPKQEKPETIDEAKPI